MSGTTKGCLCAVISAISYGLNPLGALFLYQDGVRPLSVLFYRFAPAALMLAALLVANGKSFRISRREAGVLTILGLLFCTSSLTYYYSFRFIDVGIAGVLTYFNPVIVAAIMCLFFHERLKVSTVAAIAIALGGIALLYKSDGSGTLSLTGLLLVLFSAAAYAVYMVVINQTDIRMSSVKLTFYVLVVCSAVLFAFAQFVEGGLQPLSTPRSWLSAAGLALFPTVISLVTMAMAVKLIGSTPTAILGALEPLTAVVVGVAVFGEQLTPRIVLGMTMILCAAIIIILGKRVPAMRHPSQLLRLGGKMKKHWRWK